MGVRFTQPETDRLELSDGDFLIVKRRLTTGEYRAHMMRSRTLDGQIDPFLEGRSLPLAYLHDWSLVDAEGKPVVIRGTQDPERSAILDSLDPDAFTEILRAIEAHVARMVQARAEQKKTAGSTTSSTTSPSPNTTAGAMSGSPSSTKTSTPSLSPS